MQLFLKVTLSLLEGLGTTHLFQFVQRDQVNELGVENGGQNTFGFLKTAEEPYSLV